MSKKITKQTAKKIVKKVEQKRPTIHSLGKAFAVAFSNLWRNKFMSLAAILVMAIIIFIFNIILGVNYIASSALSEITQKVDMVVYLKDDVEYYKVQQLIKDLNELQGIVKLSYTSKSDALDIVSKTHPKTAEFLERYGVENPLPPSINITTERPELHVMVQQFLNQDEYKDMLADIITEPEKQSAANEAVTKNLITLSHATNQVTFLVFFIFIIGSLFIVSNAIQLTIYTRHREIYIMRLVGATKDFIRLPFLIEGLFYGIISMLLSAGLFSIMVIQMKIAKIGILEYFTNIPAFEIFFIELGVAALLGVICSFIAVYRYLKTKLIFD